MIIMRCHQNMSLQKDKQNMRKKIKSPCIDVCKLKNDVCLGCGRTSYQIRNWSKFRSNKRDQIIQQLKSKNYSLNL